MLNTTHLDGDLPSVPTPLTDVASGTGVFMTGRMRSGKSYLAYNLSDRETVKLSAPMWAVAKHFFGEGLSKDDPDVRGLMQEIGRAGRGDFGKGLPRTASRAAFIQSVRDSGEEITQGLREGGEWFGHVHEYGDIDWSRFGQTPDFWMDVLIGRLEARSADQDYDLAPAVPDVRYPNTANRLSERGLQHVHVLCSRETRRERTGRWEDSGGSTEELGTQLDRLARGPTSIIDYEESDKAARLDGTLLRQVASGANVVWSDPDKECPGRFTRADDLIQFSTIYPAYAEVPLNRKDAD
jgi:hypothetical protein